MTRLYHIVAVNERSGAKTYLTRYPMLHSESVTMLRRFSSHPARRVQLEEVQ
jgi:hypothetical protein